MIDAPGGAGKIPVMPQYLISMSDQVAVMRNFAGAISAYALPRGYTGECPPSCAHAREQGDGVGIAGMLDGQGTTTHANRPQGYEMGEDLLQLATVAASESTCARSA